MATSGTKTKMIQPPTANFASEMMTRTTPVTTAPTPFSRAFFCQSVTLSSAQPMRSAQIERALGDIGHAIQKFAEGQGFSIVREFCGHGIGKGFHEEPQVLHYGKPGTLEELVPGMIFTIEPMINAGGRHVRLLGDGWTVVTKDHSLSAQWEHTLLVTQNGCEILTLGAGETAPSDVGAP